MKFNKIIEYCSIATNDSYLIGQVTHTGITPIFTGNGIDDKRSNSRQDCLNFPSCNCS